MSDRLRKSLFRYVQNFENSIGARQRHSVHSGNVNQSGRKEMQLRTLLYQEEEANVTFEGFASESLMMF